MVCQGRHRFTLALEQRMIWTHRGGEKAFKANTEKHRIGPDNRDHCAFIWMSGPWEVLDSRPGPDYKGPRSMDFIWWARRQLVFLCTVHITVFHRDNQAVVWWGLAEGEINRIKAKSRREMFKASTKITAMGMMGEIKWRLHRLCNWLDLAQPVQSSSAARMSPFHGKQKLVFYVNLLIPKCKQAHVLQHLSLSEAFWDHPIYNCILLHSHHLI